MSKRVPVGMSGLCLTSALALAGALYSQPRNEPFRPVIPKTWDETALADWATPVAGLNERPGHFSADEYYRAPIDHYRTYPVYAADREPAGYWEMLQKVGPKPLIEPQKLKTQADWIEAGRRVFDELDHITMRSYDLKVIATVRSFKATGPDGRVGSARWIPTEKGLAIGIANCESCHARREADGRRIPGPPVGSAGHGADGASAVVPLLSAAQHVAGAPILLPEPPGSRAYRAYAVPWIKDDIHESLKEMTPQILRSLSGPAVCEQRNLCPVERQLVLPSKDPRPYRR